MIDPAEIAELRELFDDDWPTRVHIETMTDPVHHTGDSDADTEAVLRDMRRLEAVPKLLDAAERCARLEALLREASSTLEAVELLARESHRVDPTTIVRSCRDRIAKELYSGKVEL